VVRNSLNRFAFTLIELIFAIVIISIAVISLPMMVQITSKGIEESLVQEAIFAASAELMGATSGYWDENSMQDINKSHLSRVINLAGDCNDDKLRPGHIRQPLHRRCLDEDTTVAHDSETPIGALDVFDLNDAAITQIMFTDEDKEAEGYKDTYTSSIDVNRTDNIKIITSTIKNSKDIDIVILRTQSANIGEIDYYKRRF